MAYCCTIGPFVGRTYHVFCPGCSSSEHAESLFYEPYRLQYDDSDAVRESPQRKTCLSGHQMLVTIDSVPYSQPRVQARSPTATASA